MRIMRTMTTIRRYALFILTVLIITGCANNTATTTYSYSPPTTVDGRACVDECKQSRANCKNMCTTTAPQCVAYEQQKARVHFQEYVANQRSMGQPVSRTLLSFYHPEKCAHSGCDCDNDYQVCYQLCGTRTEVHDALASQ